MKMCKWKLKKLSRKQSLHIAAVIVLTIFQLSATAQDGNAGINAANTQVRSYFASGTNLMYAVGALVGLIGAVKVYQKWNAGGISVTATNSCGTSKNGVTIYSNCSATAIAASPNPTTDNVTITVVQSKDAASSKTAKGMIYQLKVTDQSGNIKKQYKYSGVSNTTISLSGLMNGTYTIQAFDGTTWSSVNVIKQ